MPKTPRRNLTRERIAHQAARLMAEDGIQDFSLAKRKAAQMIGAADTHNLPNNSEIEQALKTFRSLYQSEHGSVLRYLREQALTVMRLLEGFNPYLTGSVLHGTAGKYSDINLRLYSDSVKELEFFLLDRGTVYRRGEKRLMLGDNPCIAPTVTLESGGVTVNIAILSENDLRIAVRNPVHRDAPGRASLAQLEALLRETK